MERTRKRSERYERDRRTASERNRRKVEQMAHHRKQERLAEEARVEALTTPQL